MKNLMTSIIKVNDDELHENEIYRQNNNIVEYSFQLFQNLFHFSLFDKIVVEFDLILQDNQSNDRDIKDDEMS